MTTGTKHTVQSARSPARRHGSGFDEVLAAHGAAPAVRGDVADELDVERLFAETIVAFGRLVIVHAVGQIRPAAEHRPAL
jgi:hypothetical protein